MVALRDRLADLGLSVLTFNYPYMEAGRKAPDSQKVLLGCHQAVAAWAVERWKEAPVLGGRSMGGRMASYLVAEGIGARGLMCLAYPLHPSGRPQSLRADHLRSIRIPMVFVRGQNDSMSQPVLFDRLVRKLPTATVIDVPKAGHNLPVTNDLVDRLADWVRSLPVVKA